MRPLHRLTKFEMEMLLLPNTAAKARGHRGQGLGGREEKPQDFKADYAPRNGQEKARSHARQRPKFQLKQKGHPFPGLKVTGVMCKTL